MAGFADRLKTSFNVLMNRVGEVQDDFQIMTGSYAPTTHITYQSSDAVLAPIITRIAVDAATFPIRHIDVDENGVFQRIRQSELNDRFSVQANIDQTGVDFILDVVTTMLNQGACAMVPIEVSTNPGVTASYDILSLRTGVVQAWNTKTVELDIYNDQDGIRVSKTLPKTYVGIAYNPFYSVMNKPNSTLNRLKMKLAMLDAADNKAGSPNLDLILQLPFAIKSSRKQQEAIARLALVEQQLNQSRYGIAYIGANERVTPLNRPVANNLMDQVQWLTEMLYKQLGITPDVFNGTAGPEEMLLYYNRTIMPILSSVTGAMRVAFLSKTAISRGQDIRALPNLFKMADLNTMAEAADKFTRNEILSTNEVRAAMGLEPAADPGADELRNKNLNPPSSEPEVKEPVPEEGG
jgi:hypothetical protein